MTLATRLGELSDRVTARMIENRRGAAGPTAIGVVRRAQIDAVVSLAPVMMGANVVNAAALWLLLHNLGSSTPASTAWALFVAAFALRGLWGALRGRDRAVKPVASPRAPGKVVLTSVLLAIVWSYPPLFLMEQGSELQVAFISAVTAGMVAGGALALYPVPLAAFSYTAVLCLLAIPAVVNGAPSQVGPFLMVMAAFSVLVVSSIRHQSVLFLMELDARIEAERRRDVVDLLLDAYHGEGGQYLWVSDEGLALQGDPAPLRRMLDLPAPPGVPARLPAILAEGAARPYDEPSATALEALGRGDTGPMVERGATVETPAGRVLRLAARPSSGAYEMPGGFVGTVRDVTAETRAEEEVHRLATQDPLTALLNYRAFGERAGARLAEVAAAGGRALFLFVDADNLKVVNDSFGHAAGDRMILAIAERMGAALPPGSVVARKGGDEFLALVPVSGRPVAEAHATALLAAFEAPFSHDGREVAFSCSIGATFGAGPLPRLELEADRALYHAKSTGRRRLRFHDDRIGRMVSRRRRLASDLAAALEAGGLDLAFQPIVDAGAGRVAGAEALLRWHHPELGPVDPGLAVEIARAEGLGTRLSAWVLARACRAAAGWEGDRFVSVNLEPADLRMADLAGEVTRIAAEAGLPPRRLWVEVTESQALDDDPTIREALEQLRAEGVAVVIDDFGAGYSSLDAFERYAFDVIKIDRALVARCHERFNATLILRTLRRLAEANGCRVVAEGVETGAELTALRRMGFDLVQGFAFHCPMAQPDLARLLARAPASSLPLHAHPRTAPPRRRQSVPGS
jgi:diguanylate cyclase (GGDEF)-like protein